MNYEKKIIDPIDYPGWDKFVLDNKNCSVFHTAGWAKVLHDSYKYKPKYLLVCAEDNKILAVLPLMETKNIFGLRRAVSLPFSDHCAPIISNGMQIGQLIENLNGSNWRKIEIRTPTRLKINTKPALTYKHHELDLDNRNNDELFREFRDSTQRNVRKAERENVKVNFSRSVDSLKKFYYLNCITRKRHGLPPQPFNFFLNIHKHIISNNMGYTILASRRGKVIAGAVFLHFGKRAVFKFGASDKNYQEFRANNLVMWEAIKRYSESKYTVLDFGRTAASNTGLIRFKEGWGTETKNIFHYVYDTGRKAFIQEINNKNEDGYLIFRIMPLSLLRLVGSIIYKYAG